MIKHISLALVVAVTASCRLWSAPTFSDPNSPNPVVTFDAPGVYTFRVSVTDGARTTTRTVQVTVNPSVVLGRMIAGTSSGIAGTSVVLPVSYSAGTANVSGMQFDIALPSGVTYSSIAAGAASTAASKSVEANVTGGVLRVIVFGLNTNTINSGSVALITLRLDADLTTGSVPISLTNAVAANAAGGSVALGPSVDGAIAVTANTAPVVTIGENQTITLPETATLQSSATDDGAPNPPGALTYTWTVQ